MKIKAHILGLVLPFFFTGLAHAEDLPEGFVVAQASSEIAVLGFHGAQFIPLETGGRFAKGVLELKLLVEGNLCTATANSVFYDLTQKDYKNFDLKLKGHGFSNPYDTLLRACTSHSAPRNITLPIQVQAWTINGPFEVTYRLPLSYHSVRAALFKVTYTDQNGFNLEVSQEE